MLLILAVALTQTLNGLGPPSRSSLSEAAAQAIAPVHQSFEKVRAAQARLPSAKNDAERLIRLAELDQAGREAYAKLELSHLSRADQSAAVSAAWMEIGRQDKADQAALLAMVPPEGWFYKSQYGEQASYAAFLIVQHGDLTLWRKFVPILRPLVASGEVDGSAYALMYDRLAMNEGRPQRYGSQTRCRANKVTLYTVENPDEIDARRKAIGLDMTEAEYLRLVKEHAGSCP